MNENKLLEQLKEVAKDEQYIKSLCESVDCEAFIAKLKVKDICVTEDEAKLLFDAVKNGIDELSEENLDNVSGGGVGLAVWGIAGAAAFLYGTYRSLRSCKW